MKKASTPITKRGKKPREWILYNIAGKPTAIGGPKIGIQEAVRVREVTPKAKGKK